MDGDGLMTMEAEVVAGVVVEVPGGAAWLDQVGLQRCRYLTAVAARPRLALARRSPRMTVREATVGR